MNTKAFTRIKGIVLMNARQKNNCKRVSRLVKMLAHPTRLEIICVLREGKKNVGEICDILDKRQANVSQHIALLRGAGVIDAERVGNTSVYFITNADVVRVLKILSGEE